MFYFAASSNLMNKLPSPHQILYQRVSSMRQGQSLDTQFYRVWCGLIDMTRVRILLRYHLG